MSTNLKIYFSYINFILQFKSDCHLIFGIGQFVTQFTRVKRNFGALSQEEEKYKFLNLILRGYILAVTHFVTQFTHVSRHPRV